MRLRIVDVFGPLRAWASSGLHTRRGGRPVCPGGVALRLVPACDPRSGRWQNPDGQRGRALPLWFAPPAAVKAAG
jgi:hypothetical protein